MLHKKNLTMIIIIIHNIEILQVRFSFLQAKGKANSSFPPSSAFFFPCSYPSCHRGPGGGGGGCSVVRKLVETVWNFNLSVAPWYYILLHAGPAKTSWKKSLFVQFHLSWQIEQSAHPNKFFWITIRRKPPPPFCKSTNA